MWALLDACVNTHVEGVGSYRRSHGPSNVLLPPLSSSTTSRVILQESIIHLLITNYSAQIELWTPHNVSLESNLDLLESPAFYLLVVSPSVFSARLHKLGHDISFFQNVIASLPRSHPLHVACVQALAIALFERYTLSGQQDDLEQSILHHTKAIFLPLPWDRRCRNIIQMLFSTTVALVHRIHQSRQPVDVKCTIVYLCYLRGQSLEASSVLPSHVIESLVHALSVRVELELGDVMLDIEEMAVLCLELLNSATSPTSPIGSIMALVRVLNAQFGRWIERKEPSEKVIECLREANLRLPDLHEVSVALAWSLFNRFHLTYSSPDYEEGTAILDKIITFRAPGGRLTQNQEIASRLIASFAQVRSTMFGKPEYLEQAIYRLRSLLGRTSLDDPLQPVIVQALSLLQGMRFDDPNVTTSLPEARLGNPEVSVHLSFRDLTASLAESSTGKSPPMAMADKNIDVLLSIDRITDIADIEEAVKYCRLLIASSHPGSVFTPLGAIALGLLLLRSFSYTNKIEHLNEAISVLRDDLSFPGVQPVYFAVVQRLISSLSIRFNMLHSREDLKEIMQLFPLAVNDIRARTPDRFQISCQWTRVARNFGHPCVSTAYDCAISLMHGSLAFAPTVEIQHSRLVAMRDSYEELPLDYASYQIQTGQLQQAIETLERGRALLWSEMRGLRTSIDQLRAANSHLADKFAAVNRDLEVLTLAISPKINDNGGEGVLEGMDPFGHLVVKQRQLLDSRDKLILQIQALRGFETFLKAPPFDNLRSAAARGPVIIINHCRWRSDILILHNSSPPSLIPTSDDFYARANKFRDQLLGAQKGGLDSNKYEEALRSVLKGLYELVGRPVIQRLNELNVTEQSRVWWCLTSALCSLPFHAMGPIPSDDGTERYFMDLYIPSYTPTLSALIESNRPSSQTLDKPSILLVAQPDASMPESLEEMQVVQVASTRVTTLISAMATPTTVLERFRDHRFTHIICHGILEPGKPFNASFKLYRDKRLSLLDIVRSRLPEAEFAFLSACHTAELTDESLADEALHLTAAMQYCGFRSVVGTMWAMADTDGRDLAENFYRLVFSGRRHGVRYYERTAKALRDAVKKLRRKRGMTLERWVNFVHYGA